MPNTLYFGDNLGVLQDYFDAECVDLVYLDPPFNSKRDFNLLFARDDRREAPAQITAFEDTWHWDTTAERHYRELVGEEPCPVKIPESLTIIIRSLCESLTRNDMMAYIVMMSRRLVELRRVLRPTGSLYLHCDPTASHYLKVILDSVFGPQNFRNEVIWQRTNVHSDALRWSPVSDSILFYSKSSEFTWNPQYVAHDADYLASKYRHVDERGRYRLDNMTSPNPRPNMMYEWRGHASPKMGWRYSRETMQKLHREGRIWYPDSKQKRPQLKRYLNETKGRLLGNVWTDIDPINSQAAERIGYPTQKPIALLERILSASTNAGDVVLDPFCGCGTTIEAAQRLGRVWAGIDVTHLAIQTIRSRIDRVLGDVSYGIGGNPADAESARVLAEENAYQFQDWAVRFVEGRPLGGGKKSKKGKDRGIDGELFFRSGGPDEPKQRAIISVKGGRSLNPGMVRDLVGTVTREGCPIGVLITAHPTTKEMRTEAARAGDHYFDGRAMPRIQLLTVDDLFNARKVQHPGDNVTEGTNPPPEQLLLFEQARLGVIRGGKKRDTLKPPRPAREGELDFQGAKRRSRPPR